MAGILIIAHAPLATALERCLSHIYGGLPARVNAIDVAPDSDPAQLAKIAEAKLSGLIKHNGALVLTDLFGATPSNIAAQLANLPHVRVLAGVNLPMLMRAVCYRATPLETLAEKSLTGGVKGIQLLTATASPSSEISQVEHHAATRNGHR